MTDTERLSYSRLTALSADEASRILSAGPQAAARLAEASAKHGVSEAQFVWAQMLLEGRGTDRDPEAGFRWFRIAAESGEAHALNMLGRCHERGWGTPVDLVEAARLFSLAADKGDAWARFNLAGLLTSSPTGDARLALSLYVRAARQGLSKAMTMIGQFREAGLGVPAKPCAALRWYTWGAARGDFRAHEALGRTALERGDISEALRHLNCALDGAFPQYRRELAERLAAQSNECVRALGRRALDLPEQTQRASRRGWTQLFRRLSARGN